jgi:hypothetical protein
VLGGRRDTGRLLGRDEVGAERGHHVGVGAVRAAELIVEVARVAVHIEHRRQVHVHADASQVLPRAGARGSGGRREIGRLADLLLRQQRLPRQAPDQAALLVGHQQQRNAAHGIQRAGVGPVELGDHAGDLGAAGDVAAEEDDPADLAVPDPVQQRGRRLEPGVAVDHPLARHLRRRERGQGVRARRGRARGRPGHGRADGRVPGRR